jgi:undecaprenyl-diphosphatase
MPRVPAAYIFGLGTGLAAGAAFAALAAGVAGHWWQDANAEMMTALHARATPDLTRVALAVTELGGASGFGAATAAVLAFLLWRKHYLDAATLAIALLGIGGLEVVLKHLFQVARPEVFPHLVYETGYGFPSGHAMRAVGLYGFVAALMVSYGPGSVWRWLGAIACGLVAVAVCVSRVYLGVHWPTDAVAGGTASAAWIGVCFASRHAALKRRANFRPD